MSWTLYESVTFDRYQDPRHRLADLSDPPLQFGPESVEVHVINRPASLSSEAAKPGRGRLRHRLQTPSPTLPENGCAIWPLTRKRIKDALTRERW